MSFNPEAYKINNIDQLHFRFCLIHTLWEHNKTFVFSFPRTSDIIIQILKEYFRLSQGAVYTIFHYPRDSVFTGMTVFYEKIGN